MNGGSRCILNLRKFAAAGAFVGLFLTVAEDRGPRAPAGSEVAAFLCGFARGLRVWRRTIFVFHFFSFRQATHSCISGLSPKGDFDKNLAKINQKSLTLVNYC